MNTHIRFDWAMKRLLRQKSNFGILEGFLSELLEKDVLIQELLESEGNKESEEDKFNRVDILAKLNDKELVLIEVQNDREHDYFHRMNYGQAKLISERLEIGAKYAEVKRVISINIVYFELGQGQDYIYHGQTEFKGKHTHDVLQLSNTQRKLFPNVSTPSEIFPRYYIIKVNQFNNIAKDTLDEWIYFLKNSEIPDSFKARGLAEAKEKMRVAQMTKAEREQYDRFVKIQRIRQGEIDSAKADAELALEKLELEKQELEKQAKVAEEQMKAAAEKVKAAAEKAKAAAEKAKAAAEKAKAAEVQAKAAEEQAKAAEEQAKIAEEQAKNERQQREAAEQTIINTIKQLHSMNIAKEQIALITGKTVDEIVKVLAKK